MADPAAAPAEGCTNEMPREGDDDDDDNGEGGGDGDGDEAASPPLHIALMSGRLSSSGGGEIGGVRARRQERVSRSGGGRVDAVRVLAQGRQVHREPLGLGLRQRLLLVLLPPAISVHTRHDTTRHDTTHTFLSLLDLVSREEVMMADPLLTEGGERMSRTFIAKAISSRFLSISATLHAASSPASLATRFSNATTLLADQPINNHTPARWLRKPRDVIASPRRVVVAIMKVVADVAMAHLVFEELVLEEELLEKGRRDLGVFLLLLAAGLGLARQLGDVVDRGRRGGRGRDLLLGQRALLLRVAHDMIHHAALLLELHRHAALHRPELTTDN
jgi:hypothetical protein